jgi:nucleoside-diphosphate-sugar epimerase
MKILILGCGQAGLEIARHAKAKGWEVIGTTTTPGRVAEIEAVCDKAVVVLGSDREGVKKAAEGVDAIVVSVSPSAVRSAKKEDRGPIYQEVLVESGLSASEAHDRVIFCSSISVYGDGTQESGKFLTEATPRAINDEPSTIFFSAGEDAAMKAARGTVMRFPDIYSDAGDFQDRVKLALEYMGGSTPFDRADAYHPIHVEDVARAMIHALENDVEGVFNVVPDGVVPAPTVGEFWDKVSAKHDLPKLEFRGEIRTPLQQSISEKFRATGFEFKHQISEVV